MGPTLVIAVSCLGNKEGLKRCCETMGHLTKRSFVKIGRIINGSPSGVWVQRTAQRAARVVIQVGPNGPEHSCFA